MHSFNIDLQILKLVDLKQFYYETLFHTFVHSTVENFSDFFGNVFNSFKVISTEKSLVSKIGQISEPVSKRYILVYYIFHYNIFPINQTPSSFG